MNLTRQNANREMFGVIKTAWDTTGFGSRVKYQNVGTTSTPPDGTGPWIRVFVRENRGVQITMARPGNRVFLREGNITVEVFESLGGGLVNTTTDYSDTIRDAMEGVTTDGGVRFRDVSIVPIGPNGDFFQTNVVSRFEYEERK